MPCSESTIARRIVTITSEMDTFKATNAEDCASIRTRRLGSDGHHVRFAALEKCAQVHAAGKHIQTTGAARSRLSNRSRRPPWPGTSRPESLTPIWRLRSDLQRSPSWAAAPANKPRASHRTGDMARAGSRTPQARAAATEAARPPSAPSTVLPGEIAGASLCRPTARPNALTVSGIQSVRVDTMPRITCRSYRPISGGRTS